MANKKMIIIIVSIVVIVLVLVIIGFLVLPAMINNSAQESLNSVTESEDNNTEDGEEGTALSLEEQSKQVFNQMFTVYETEDGETLARSSVLTLFDTLANHNEEDEERKIDINGTVVTQDNKESLKQVLTNDTRYAIKCIYDDEGYVKTIELRYVNESENEDTNENTNQNTNQNNVNSSQNETVIENPVQ